MLCCVETNVGKEFFKLIDKCFTSGHKLRKIFNRNTLKLSYSCMPNVKQIIDGHNKTILKKAEQQDQDNLDRTCNCRKKEECPLNRECLTKEIVYQATVKSQESTETYVGLTSNEFKTRWRNHKISFNKESRKNETELSKHIWQLKDRKQEYDITWKILAKAKAYSNQTKRCHLCIAEKYFILTKPQMASLNRRNELISTCRHRRKYILRYSLK